MTQLAPRKWQEMHTRDKLSYWVRLNMGGITSAIAIYRHRSRGTEKASVAQCDFLSKTESKIIPVLTYMHAKTKADFYSRRNSQSWDETTDLFQLEKNICLFVFFNNRNYSYTADGCLLGKKTHASANSALAYKGKASARLKVCMKQKCFLFH